LWNDSTNKIQAEIKQVTIHRTIKENEE